jgi:hypothetical protein
LITVKAVFNPTLNNRELHGIPRRDVVCRSSPWEA